MQPTSTRFLLTASFQAIEPRLPAPNELLDAYTNLIPNLPERCKARLLVARDGPGSSKLQ